MKKILLPLVMLLIGTGAGVGAGIFLKPKPAEAGADAKAEDYAGDPAKSAEAKSGYDDHAETEFARLNNQFVVPILGDDRINAMVVLTLSVEVPYGKQSSVFDLEPKVRDGFLRVLFAHANIGGFSGNFTSAENLRILREDLHLAASEIVGEDAIGVLILDMIRQDT